MTNTHFRAKSNGVWVYGYLYNNFDRGVNQTFIVRDNEDTGTGEHILVDSNTTGISICTMLRDKNGNLIYEGDLLVDEAVSEYGAEEIRCHLSYVGERPENDKEFITVIPSIYD